MTFLELVQRLRDRSSVAGTGPSTVLGQTGELGRLVSWIVEADNEIQNKWFDWKFLWDESSFDSIDTVADYSLPLVAHFATFDPGSGRHGPKVWLGDDQLNFVPWSQFDKVQYTATGQPYDFTVKPDGKIKLAPTPDAVYTIDYEYYKKPVLLANNGDVSLIPERFHNAIIARALIFYANYEAAGELKEEGGEWLSSLMMQLEADQLPNADHFRYSSNNDIQVEVH